MKKNKPKYEGIASLKVLRNFVYNDGIDYNLMIHEVRTLEYEDDCVDDDHIVLWLAENTIGTWSTNIIGKYYFEDACDAMACKLRWL